MEILTDQVISVDHSTAGDTEDTGEKKEAHIRFEAEVGVENICFSSYLFVEAEVGQFQLASGNLQFEHNC